jgi:hypothetical protein
VREDGPIVAMIRAVDRAMLALGLPPYFDDPRPHMSYTWTEGPELHDRLAGYPLSSQATPRESICAVNRVCVKIGKETYQIAL